MVSIGGDAGACFSASGGSGGGAGSGGVVVDVREEPLEHAMTDATARERKSMSPMVHATCVSEHAMRREHARNTSDTRSVTAVMKTARWIPLVTVVALGADALAAPCFADRKTLVASAVHRDLHLHAVFVGTPEAPPPERYGTCTVGAGTVRDDSGTLVADLSCGITVHVKGIVDHLGFEVGAPGRDIAKAYPNEEAVCREDWGGFVRCWFQPDDGLPPAHYIFKGTLRDATLQHPARGKRARTFVRTHRVRRVVQRMHCH